MATHHVTVIIIGREPNPNGRLTNQQVTDAQIQFLGTYIDGCNTGCPVTRAVLFGENVNGVLEAVFVNRADKKPDEVHVFTFSDRSTAKVWLDALASQLDGKEIYMIDRSYVPPPAP